MKVLVIGGTGVFGARLCDLLAQDGHRVVVASRSGGLPDVGDTAQMEAMRFDRDGPLDEFSEFDLIVDAAGPFHAYGEDPYRIARAAIAAKRPYFDLSDNADFCQGINVLNDAAKSAGVAVVSGMSSVPAVTSAAVVALTEGVQPLAIEAAILPGNKSPRGRAVVESILNQAGQSYVERRGGAVAEVRSWSDPKLYDLGGERRQAWCIEVPDQRLFPEAFGCENVTFRAGLELGVMRYGLSVWSWLRGRLGFGVPSWLGRVVYRVACLLKPFGTNNGGMVVEVIVADGDGFERRRWTLWAGKGDGPYVPGMAVRAACRDIAALPVGAGPAVGVVGLPKIEACLADLDIKTECSVVPEEPVFRQVLGAELDALDGVVAQSHNTAVTRHFRGMASVVRGKGIMACVASLLFGFPPSSEAIEVSVTKEVRDGAEHWTRRFGARVFRSTLRPKAQGMTERFGLLTFDLGLTIQDGALHFPVIGGRCLGVPIPRALLPQSEAVEREVEGRFAFDVHLKAPTGSTLVHYRGWLERVGNS